MVKKWCINCQAEREHAPIYGLRKCENNCDHLCPECGLQTLASIDVNLDDTGYFEIKQMIGEAQRIEQRSGKTGDIEVVKNINDYQAQVLVYNTYSGSFSVNRR